MRTCRLLLVGLLPLAACSGSQTPCSGSGCLAVAGSYTFVLGEAVSCSVWEKSAPPSSLMEVAQGSSASQLNITLWPVTDTPHYLTGTLYADGSIDVAESQQSTLLGIPWATLTGSFSSNSGQAGGPPFYFSGQIFLQGGGAQSTSTGAASGLGCQGGTTFKAEEAAGGTLPDAGGTPDGGHDGGL